MIKTPKLSISLRDVILGGQDGLVNVLGLTLGLVAAQAESRIVIIAGLAAALSEAISMGAVAYTSSYANRDLYLKSEYIITKEYEEDPNKIKDRLREVFIGKKLKNHELENLIDHIMKDKELAISMMVRYGLEIQPVETKGLILSSIVVTISAIVGALIPLIPFIISDRSIELPLSIILSGIALFAVGAYSAITLVGNWWKSGLKMLLIGLLSAFAGFIIGLILKV